MPYCRNCFIICWAIFDLYLRGSGWTLNVSSWHEFLWMQTATNLHFLSICYSWSLYLRRQIAYNCKRNLIQSQMSSRPTASYWCFNSVVTHLRCFEEDNWQQMILSSKQPLQTSHLRPLFCVTVTLRPLHLSMVVIVDMLPLLHLSRPSACS